MDKYKIKENYVTRDPNPEVWEEHANSVILKRYKDKITGSVLDFGCNHGSCSFLILDNPNVSNVLGLDLNEDAISIAYQTKKEKYKNSPIEFELSNILNFDYGQKFDTIITFHTLEHIYPEDVDLVLTKLKNLLSPKGYLIISIPYEMAYNDPKQHVAYYNENSLSNVFMKNGFEKIECYMDTNCGAGGILTGLFRN